MLKAFIIVLHRNLMKMHIFITRIAFCIMVSGLLAACHTMMPQQDDGMQRTKAETAATKAAAATGAAAAIGGRVSNEVNNTINVAKAKPQEHGNNHLNS